MSIDRTVTKKVCTRNQWATNTTMENAQNWRMAPLEKNAMTPSTELQVQSFKEFDVPACPRPSAMRSLTGKAIEVLTTAST